MTFSIIVIIEAVNFFENMEIFNFIFTIYLMLNKIKIISIEVKLLRQYNT